MSRTWWRDAVIYQVYVRSFADSDGDGVGDIEGIRSRLGYLADLGVDAIWINPWYPSPQHDAGYDVSDYRDIEPQYGTLAEAERLLTEAHQHGLRVLLDIVPNHTSDDHPWFRAALEAGPGSPERARFLFRDGRGTNGELPPNDWQSQFGGPAWSRVTEPDGQWYLRLYAPEQPDLDWTNADVRADFEETLRFWFDRGVDGFRIDVAHGLIKADGLPDVAGTAWPRAGDAEVTEHPHWDRAEVHEIYRAWRAIAESYDDPRVFVAEAWVRPPERLARYVRPDELNTAFNFDFLLTPWQAPALVAAITSTTTALAAVGAPPTWVLSNHDTAREVSRYARPQGVRMLRHLQDLLDLPADFELGERRARAAALLMLALPGGAYVYQGEELGLAEVEDLPDDALRDPKWAGSGHTDRGRDGCRVPIPWSEGPSFGFSPPDARESPWLPQPARWAGHSAASQLGDPASMLELYRAALRLRRAHDCFGDGPLQWLDAPDGALAFRRPGDSTSVRCLVNVSAEPLELPGEVLIASGPLADGRLPSDTAAWVAD